MTDMVKRLTGWDGPEYRDNGMCRYSKTQSWIKMYIDVDISEFWGGVTGTEECFEIAMEEGIWKRFCIDLAETPEGDILIRLLGYTTWDLVFERTSEGEPIDEKIETIDDLAAYLEKCIPASG